jgi:hypothetical protein
MGIRKGRVVHTCPRCKLNKKAIAKSGKRLGYCRNCHNAVCAENKAGKKTERSNFKWAVPGISGKYYRYKKGAEKRGLVWEISKREFEQLVQMPCDLCGTEASQSEGMGNEPTKFNGIDRRDSDIGYTLANSVPCCWNCNRMKGEESLAETLRHCRLMLIWNDWGVE